METRSSSSSASEPADARARNPLDIIQRLRSIANELLSQMELHGQLLKVEWEEEKNRLVKMFAISLMGFACLLCFMIFIGILAVVISWPTNYRLVTIGGLVVFYALGVLACVIYLKRISAQSSGFFTATREEISADLALLRDKL
jgi:uncharacterized membrane protein YqjE